MIYDISPEITERLCVWPGDTPPRREVLCDLRKGASVTLSSLHSTVPLGAHADGPNHYGVDAPGIGERALHYYIGRCQVIHVPVGRSELVNPRHIEAGIEATRVLIRTGTFPDPTTFNEDFAALSPSLVDWLRERGVRLIGIDTPSVDPFHSKELPAHHAFLRHDMAILEGITLASVPVGLYELIALPLRLIGFDGSPVRAVLRTLGG